MTITDGLDRFMAFAEKVTKETFVEGARLAHQSVQQGSALTGAPGQRVDTGFMETSFILDFESDTRANITTNVSYAPIYETGNRDDFNDQGVDRPKGLGAASDGIPSTVGGDHSVEKTATGWQNIVDHAIGTAREKVSPQ